MIASLAANQTSRSKFGCQTVHINGGSHRRLFMGMTLVLGNVNGSLSRAMWCMDDSADLIFSFMRSLSVGGLTRQPSSRKY